jgi:hypothetical protein
MWRDYVGLVPAAIAIAIGVMAVFVAQFPLKTATGKTIFIVIIALLGVLTIGATVWSQRLSLVQRAEEQSRRAEIRDGLAVLIAQGSGLMRQCANEVEPPPTAAADDWAARTEAFLTEKLGTSYVVRFRSDTGLPFAPTSIASLPHRNLWAGIYNRMVRLKQFSEEIPR